MPLTLPKFLGLNKKEIVILNEVFKLNEMTLLALSKKTKIPRTTLYTHLRHLKARGLIVLTKKEKYLYITLNHNFFIGNAFASGIADDKRNGFFQGEEFLKKYVYYATHLTGSDRIKWIQPTYATRKVLELTDQKDFADMSGKIMKNGIIVESILEPDFFDALKKYVLSHKDGKRILNHYLNRPYETYISDQLPDKKTEIIIYKEFAVYSNWETKTGFVTHDKDMIGFFGAYFEMLKSQAKRVNQADEMKNFFA